MNFIGLCIHIRRNIILLNFFLGNKRAPVRHLIAVKESRHRNPDGVQSAESYGFVVLTRARVADRYIFQPAGNP